MSPQRQLAAIMFCDIVGYTSMMQQSEQNAIASVKRLEEILNRLVPQHQGEILQNYGDGSLLLFGSATHAASCAIAIQTELNGGDKLPVRIGIHLGDVLRDGNRIFGDGVNLASRIESLGIAGAIMISASIKQQIANNGNFNITEVGIFDFKNVAIPMLVYAISNDGITVPDEVSTEAKGKHHEEAPTSIMVLPFDQAGTIEEGYYLEGIADEIRSQLLALSDLRVISRSSSNSCKSRGLSLSDIRDEMDVDYVLEGRIRVMPGRFRLGLELCNTTTHAVEWSPEAITHELENIFELEMKVARDVANQLRVELQPSEKLTFVDLATRDSRAHELYKLGQESLHRADGRLETLANAKQLFQEAIDIDPGFYKAYVGLSDAFMESVFWGRAPVKSVLSDALSAAFKALELDDGYGACYGTLGVINFYRMERATSLKYLHKALELSPSYLPAYDHLAWLSASIGEFQIAKDYLSQAHALDPLSNKYVGDQGHVYYWEGDYDNGIELIEEALKKTPDDDWLLWMPNLNLTKSKPNQT